MASIFVVALDLQVSLRHVQQVVHSSRYLQRICLQTPTSISKSGYLGDWGEWEILSEDSQQ